MRSVYISIILLGLTACTGIGYVATSDPKKLVGQAYSLMAEDRLLLAEDVIRQALEIAEEQGNTSAMAEAYKAYGELYKYEKYHNGRYTATFKKMGTYDGTYSKSIDNFNKCVELFNEVNKDAPAATCLAGVGMALSLRGDNAGACAYYEKALTKYQRAKQTDPNFIEPQMLCCFENTGELIEAYMLDEQCN
jgi:tetratricopeptide (TPR) repeat protein